MSKVGFVYLISSTSGHYKIGSSKKPNNRIKQLAATTGPYELELIKEVKVYAPEMYEGVLQEYFADYRVLGEWFDFDEDGVRKVNHQFDLLEQMEFRPS